MTIAPLALVEELSRRLDAQNDEATVIAFDGDGTLWSGDVGEDLFHAALEAHFLREEAREALAGEVSKLGIAPGARDVHELAGALMTSYLAGEYPERDVCAMMAWCYAGRSLAEVTELSEAVLEEHDIRSRLTDELGPVLEWSRRNAVRSVLISASPRVIVEAAGSHWGFAPDDIAAATPKLLNGKVLAELAAPVPYAEAKCSAGRALFAGARWLASFGDNVFDVEMLQAAELGVAVRPKPKLLRQVDSLGFSVLGPMQV